jgi:mycoredoxin
LLVKSPRFSEMAEPLENYLKNNYVMQPTKIIMYTTESCADCRRAKAFFDANGIEYINIGLEGNDEATDFVTRVNNGNRSVPTIVFPDGTVLVEPTWEELRRKTESA